MIRFDWEQGKAERKLELSLKSAESRSRNLATSLQENGLLTKHSGDQLARWIAGRIDKLDIVEAGDVLWQFGETHSFDIEGDYYETGSYSRELEHFFALTGGDVCVSNLSDEVDARQGTVKVDFDWQGEHISLFERPPDPIDGFDVRFIEHINQLLGDRGHKKRFVQFYRAEMDQILHWLYLELTKSRRLEEERLVIFSERIPYSPEALEFYW